MKSNTEKIVAITVGMIIGIGGMSVTVAWFKEDSHRGVYEIGFKEDGTVNRFTIYKGRLHLMVALPVTGKSGTIIDTRKEVEDAKDKSRIIPGTPNPKDNKPARR